MLADEQAGVEPPATCYLTCHTTVHPIAAHAIADPVSRWTLLIRHMTYDTLGRVWTTSNPFAEPRFAFTGRDLDPASGPHEIPGSKSWILD